MALTKASPSVIGPVTGTGSVVLSVSPTLVTPVLGTPTSGNLANCTFPTLNQSTTGIAANVSGVVAAVNGGTGLAAPGVSGNILTSNGTAWTSAAAPTPTPVHAGLTSVIFGSSGSLVLPTGITRCTVICIGGGGGGAGSGSNSSAGGKGGVGWAYITGLSGTIVITVGAGGGVNVAGGTSSFGSYLTATGGAGANTAAGSSSTTGTSIKTGAFSVATLNPLGINTGSTQNVLLGSTTPIIWTTGLTTYSAGASGFGTTLGGSGASAGVGGLVFVQY